jgi:4'-phosphopantetheinyl transferase
MEFCWHSYANISSEKTFGTTNTSELPQDNPMPTIRKTAKGKPFFSSVDAAHIHFSISHSGRVWAVLFGDAEVGLDLEDCSFRFQEKSYDSIRFEKIAQRFFSKEELAHLSQAQDALSHEEIFFSIWTKKEAYLKYTGEGLTRSLSAFSVYNIDATFQTIALEDRIYCTVCASEIRHKDIQIIQI